MLENEDIQHILLTRTPALTGRYEFLSFRNAAGGRAWLSAIREKAQSAAEVMASVETDKRWVTVAFTWNGFRAPGGGGGFAGHLPRRVQTGHGRPRGDPRRYRGEPSRQLGGRPRQPGPPRHRHPVRPRRR